MVTSANGTLAMCNEIRHVQAKKVKFQLKNTNGLVVVFLYGTCFFTLTFINDGKTIQKYPWLCSTSRFFYTIYILFCFVYGVNFACQPMAWNKTAGT